MAINPTYLDKKVRKNAFDVYNRQEPKNIRLDNFFQRTIFELLLNKLIEEKWKLKFDPYKYKYYFCKSLEVEEFLKGKYFQMIVKDVVGLKKFNLKYEIRKFDSGCYTLLHDTEREKEGVDFIIDFSNGLFGGYTKYLTGEKELLQINPTANTISFVSREKGVMKYIKYVNHKQKWPIIMVVGVLS